MALSELRTAAPTKLACLGFSLSYRHDFRCVTRNNLHAGPHTNMLIFFKQATLIVFLHDYENGVLMHYIDEHRLQKQI